MFVSGHHQVHVHLIGYDNQVATLGEVCQCRQLLTGKDASDRIMRTAEHDHFRVVLNPRFHVRNIEMKSPIVILSHRTLEDASLIVDYETNQRPVSRHGHEDTVTWFGQERNNTVYTYDGTRGTEHHPFPRNVPAMSSLKPVLECFKIAIRPNPVSQDRVLAP